MAKGLIERLWDDGRRALEIQEVLDARFGPGMSEIDEVLKSGDDAIIFAGLFRGQRAVFKQFLRGVLPKRCCAWRRNFGFYTVA